jgi:hypothetical protein
MLGLTLIPIVDEAKDSVEAMLMTAINGVRIEEYMPFFTVLGGMLFILALAWWMSKPRHHPKEERKMSSKTREARRAYVQSRVSDAIVAAIEDAIYKKEITNDEGKWWYRKFATSCELKDLLPKGPYKIVFPNKEELKRNIKARVGNGLYKEPAKLPKEEPKTQTKSLKDMFLARRM